MIIFKKIFLIFLLLCLSNSFGQFKQIIITSIEKTDRTFDKRGELLLENLTTKNQIIYTVDTINKRLITNEYLIETFYSIWDGNKIIKEKRKRKFKKWKNGISLKEHENILNSLNTNIDSLEKKLTFLHTSHHYLNIYIEVVNQNDSIRYFKTKPFLFLTPWWKKDLTDSVLNPSIDTKIVLLLPEKFVGREELIHSVDKKND